MTESHLCPECGVDLPESTLRNACHPCHPDSVVRFTCVGGIDLSNKQEATRVSRVFFLDTEGHSSRR